MSGGIQAAVEFKHNLLHDRQLAAISTNTSRALQQLRAAHTELRPLRCYYIHFVFELEGEQESRVAAFHNKHVRTEYKKFMSIEKLAGLRQKVYAKLGIPFGVYALVHPNDIRARGALVCWAYETEMNPGPVRSPQKMLRWALPM
jgi:hypothetical protein